MHKKHIGFSQTLLAKGLKRADVLGISFPEYIRFLVIKDIEPSAENVNTIADVQLAESVSTSLQQHAAGDNVVLDSDEAIDDLVHHISNE